MQKYILIQHRLNLMVYLYCLYLGFVMTMKEKVLEHQGITILTYWNSENFDIEVGEETSVDGYSIYYMRYKDEPFNIQEHIFYDEYGLTEALQEKIQDETDITFMVWDDELIEHIDWEEIASNLCIDDDEPFLDM